MANTVKIKRSAVAGRNPQTTDLELGELALNTHDGNLFFKKDNGSESVVGVVTLDGQQTLANKTFVGLTTINGDLDMSAAGAGLIDDQGSDGSSNQILISTGSGIRWVDNTSGTLEGLSDVSLSNIDTNQILKYNGTVWVNADENAVVTSAVFATNATSDLGLVTDANISLTEDLQGDGLGGEIAAYYNLGALAIDGVVGLRNVDQSLKADYISYAIIFGF